MSILIPLDRITDNPWQTREAYDQAHIEALAKDIEQNGLLQAPVGRLVTIGGVGYAAGEEITAGGLRYIIPDVFENPTAFWGLLRKEIGIRIQLAFGHNRLRALRLLGREHMPVELRILSNEQMALMAWGENAQRKDLNAVEEARAIRKRMEDFGWTKEQVAERLGIHRSTVSNKLRLLDLPEEILEHVVAGRISERQAAAMLPAFQMSEEEVAAIRSIPHCYKPDNLLERALSGSTSDHIRHLVQAMKERAAMELERRRKAEEVRQRIKEEAEAKGEDAAGVKVPLKSDLGYDNYRTVSDDPRDASFVAGCSPECACRQKVIGYGGDVEIVCIDPSRHDKLKAARTREKKAARKEQVQRKLDQFHTKIDAPDGRPVWTPQAIRVIVQAAIAGSSVQDVRAAVKVLGLDEDTYAGLNGEWKKREPSRKALEDLDMDTALRFALEVLIQEDLRKKLEEEIHETEDFDIVMRGVPYAESASPERSGNGAEVLEPAPPTDPPESIHYYRRRFVAVTGWMRLCSYKVVALSVLKSTIKDLQDIVAKCPDEMRGEVDQVLAQLVEESKRREADALTV